MEQAKSPQPPFQRGGKRCVPLCQKESKEGVPLCQKESKEGVLLCQKEELSLVDVYIAVGSNIEPERNIAEALDRLKRYVHIKAISTFYRTAPIGRPEQSAFLNGVWQIDTVRTARALKFGVLRQIESELGRVRTEDKYAARTIDLDIAVYGDAVINEPDLRIPDPDIRQRPFIAVPLLELAPSLVLPDTGERLSSLAIPKASAGLEPACGFTDSLRARIKLRTNKD